MSQLRLDVREEKPDFRIPTMKEINSEVPNGLELVSLFSGCGGSCLGFRMAGFRTLFASEFVPAAADTYRANYPEVHLDVRDIRELDPSDVLEIAGKFRGEIDVVEGSPPCASFSMVGNREADWNKVKKYSDVEQRTDDLFDEYVRMIDGLRPRVFVAENVPGLITGDAPEEYIQGITKKLASFGYRIEAKILNASHFGVPQRRRRLIIQGVRKDIYGFPNSERFARPAWPDPLPYTYSIRDALPELVAVQSCYGFDGHAFYSADDPAETIPQNPGGKKLVEVRKLTGSEHVADNVAPDLEGFAIGEAWDEVEANGQWSERYFSLARPDLDKPLPALTQTGGNPGAASVVHPTEKRKFTIGELRKLCGFPEDFVLTGSYSQQWERLGRAVPPPLMAAVAASIRDNILS